MNDPQIGLDFDTPQPGPELPAVAAIVEPVVEVKQGPELCSVCSEAILPDDVFGSQYGEHEKCFDRFPF